MIMRRLDRLHLEYPFAGARMLRGLLAAEGSKIGRRRNERNAEVAEHGEADFLHHKVTGEAVGGFNDERAGC